MAKLGQLMLIFCTFMLLEIIVPVYQIQSGYIIHSCEQIRRFNLKLLKIHNLPHTGLVSTKSSGMWLRKN